MVSPSIRRRAVKQMIEERLGRTAHACRALELGRSSYYLARARSERSVKLEQRIWELSRAHPRYGYRRVTAVLRREGEEINAKRVQRVRRAEGLQVRERQKRMKRVGESSAQRQRAETMNAVWSWDFVEDQTENGTRFRVLTLIDEYSRVCFATHAGWFIRAADVITVVETAMARHGRPLQRQRPRVHRVCDPGLAGGRAERDDIHHARQPVGEPVYRELPRQAARRVPEPRAVRQPARGAGDPRSVAARIQRVAAAQFA